MKLSGTWQSVLTALLAAGTSLVASNTLSANVASAVQVVLVFIATLLRPGTKA